MKRQLLLATLILNPRTAIRLKQKSGPAGVDRNFPPLGRSDPDDLRAATLAPALPGAVDALSIADRSTVAE